MDQHVLVATSTAPVQAKTPQVEVKKGHSDDSESSFSSELEKYTDKSKESITTKSADSKTVDGEKEPKTEKVEGEDGKELPEDEQLIDENQDNENQVNVYSSVDELASDSHLTSESSNKAVVLVTTETINQSKTAAQPELEKIGQGKLVTDKLITESSNILRPDIRDGLSRKSTTALQKDISASIFQSDIKSSADSSAKVMMTEKTILAQSLTPEGLEKSALKGLMLNQGSDRGAVPAAMTSSVTSTATPSMTRTDIPVFNIQPSMQNEAWGKVLTGRVLWMAKEGVQQASLKLNPASLGPVEVKLNLQHDQASVSFVAQHAATRDALEQALPRLRDSFNQNGMELTNADVSHQSQNQESLEQQANESRANNGNLSTQQDVDDETLEQGLIVTEQEELSGVSIYA